MSWDVKDEKVRHELERIKRENGGLLHAADIVDAASRKRSPLHKYFTWDDTEAAKKWRIHQARLLICVVKMGSPVNSTPTRTFVSLTTDRASGGGYRSRDDVIASPKLREQYLKDALRDMRAFRERYVLIKDELALVLKAHEDFEREYSDGQRWNAERAELSPAAN